MSETRDTNATYLFVGAKCNQFGEYSYEYAVFGNTFDPSTVTEDTLLYTHKTWSSAKALWRGAPGTFRRLKVEDDTVTFNPKAYPDGYSADEELTKNAKLSYDLANAEYNSKKSFTKAPDDILDDHLALKRAYQDLIRNQKNAFKLKLLNWLDN